MESIRPKLGASIAQGSPHVCLFTFRQLRYEKLGFRQLARVQRLALFGKVGPQLFDISLQRSDIGFRLISHLALLL